MTKLGPQNHALVGSQGVALVVYTLRRLGYPAMEAAEGLPFDVVSLHAGRPIRIQSKSTQAASGGCYNFITAKGRWATKTRHSASLTTYTGDEVDILACAALSIDKVLFVPVTSITTSKLQIPEARFADSDVSATSLRDSLETLKLT